MKAIELIGMTKSYGKARGVMDLNFSVEEGEFFGFIGPNGAGKSTTIRSLLGLMKPTEGECRIMGMNCWTDKNRILSDVGYLPSENAFYPGMKVKDILKLSADLRGMNCKEEAARLCEVLSLDVEKKASELSYGNRKKLSIICAMQHKPKALILDEPTGGLDPLMQKAFFELLNERHKEGTTIFFSSHILSEVQNNCDRTAIIKQGRLIACDRVENLKKNNVKRVMFTGQADLTSLEGVKDMVQTGKTYNFLYNGEVGTLVRVIASGVTENLTIQEPDLEEVFMHYYEED